MGIISTTISSTQVTTSDLQASKESAASSTHGGDMLPETSQRMLQVLTTSMEAMFSQIVHKLDHLGGRVTNLEKSIEKINFARVWFFKTGCKYEGQFDEDGQPHGLGIGKWDGHSYTGTYNHGLRHGSGKIVFSDKTEYEGEFQNDLIQGRGVMRFNNRVYEGEFLNEKEHGQGKLTFTNGDMYEGGFMDGKLHGQGMRRVQINKTTNGIVTGSYYVVYVGGFQEGKYHGHGKLTHGDEYIYEGTFDRGDKHGLGKGRMQLPMGLYEGELLNGLPHGQGKMTDNFGNIFVGEHKNGLQIGFCICTYTNGDVYRGRMENYTKGGQGTMTYANGDILEGIFSWINVRVGMTMRCKNGNVYTGKFIFNVFVEGEGTLITPEGDTYIGKIKHFRQFLNGKYIDDVKPDGEGVLIEPCGRQHQQTWKDGICVSSEMIYESYTLVEILLKDS